MSFQTGTAHENILQLSHRWSDPAMAEHALIRLMPRERGSLCVFPLTKSE